MGGIGNSVGLSKNVEVLDTCGLGTVGSALYNVVVSTSFLSRGKVEVEAATTRGEEGNGGGRVNGFGGLNSVVHEVLNKSLREVESERGLVVVVDVVILGVCMVVMVFVEIGFG